MGRIRKEIGVSAKSGIGVSEKNVVNVERVMEAAGLLKDSVVDEQAKKIEGLENALVYKDKVIDRIKKKNAKRMAAKCEVIEVLNEEIAYQYKRRDKAEKLVEALGKTFESLKEKNGSYELLSVNKE